MFAMDEDARRIVFQQVQPVFSRILDHAAEPRQLSQLLCAATALVESDVLLRKHLPACQDYLLFPFQFLLPSIIACNQAGMAGPVEGGRRCSVPAMSSTVAAEHALRCLHAILAAAALQTAQQVSGLMAWLVEIAHISKGAQYNEEMCMTALRCICALLEMAPSLAKSMLHEVPNWDATLGYLMHGLFGIAEREQQGKGFGVYPP